MALQCTEYQRRILWEIFHFPYIRYPPSSSHQGTVTFATCPSKPITGAIEILTRESRLMSGRYETGLLWKHDGFRLPCNNVTALRRYHCLRKKMERDTALAAAIKDKMREYE
uniref:Uncharacterized protein n=1 Tax=Anopheles stephensi TaxID=30069 RepID=A0A182YRV8_ANOST